MLIFALTTTTKVASLCLYDEKKGLLGEIQFEVLRTHSMNIMEQIEKLFLWSNTSIEDVSTVLVSIGPGSFTGIRISMSIIKGLFFDKQIKIYEVNELDALAYQAYIQFNYIFKEKKSIKIISLIDSYKEKVYYSVYTALIHDEIYHKKTNYMVAKLDDVLQKIVNDFEEENIFLVGSAAYNYKSKILENLSHKKESCYFVNDFQTKIRASIFIEMFLADILHEVDIFSLKPYYLDKISVEKG